MRTEICDINLYPPTPKVSSLIAENKVLKVNNSKLKYIMTGVAIASAIGSANYLRKKYLELENTDKKLKVLDK